MNGLEYLVTTHSERIDEFCAFYNRPNGSKIFAMDFLSRTTPEVARILIERMPQHENPAIVDAEVPCDL